MDDNQRASIASCISLLAQANKFHYLSIGLTMSASIVLLVSGLLPQLSAIWFFILIVVVLLGVGEVYCAVRAGFDQRLLSLLVKEYIDISDDLAQLDSALIGLKLLPQDKKGRDLAKRLLGCLKLFKVQLALCYLQLAAIVFAAAFSFLYR